MVNIVQQGTGRRRQAARRVPAHPRARAGASSRRSSSRSSTSTCARSPARRPPGGDHEGQRRRHRQRDDLHAGRRRRRRRCSASPNFDVAIDALARTALRSVIGTMTLDQALSERERINTDVQQQMEVVTDKWGIRISRIEIVEIAPPPQILQALALQKQADQEKRARILQSEGQQQSAINVAEGDAQAAVRRRRGREAGGDPARRRQPAGRDPRGRGPGAGDRDRLRRDQAPPTPTRRWWPSCSSTRCRSSPTATTPRSSCRTRAPA